MTDEVTAMESELREQIQNLTERILQLKDSL